MNRIATDALWIGIIAVIVGVYVANVADVIRLIVYDDATLLSLIRIPLGAIGAWLIGIGAWRRTTYAKKIRHP
jgi:hypothetical protein